MTIQKCEISSEAIQHAIRTFAEAMCQMGKCQFDPQWMATMLKIIDGEFEAHDRSDLSHGHNGKGQKKEVAPARMCFSIAVRR